MSRLFRRTAIASGVLLSGYLADKYYNAETFQRNFRTLGSAIIIALDYKLNFDVENPEIVQRIHARMAKIMHNVCKKNGGLYIKFGQQISTVPVLPSEYYDEFKEFYDNAPSVSFQEVERIFKEEFGMLPLQVFKTFSQNPIASASIAQVHLATLMDDTKVAVKVQKPNIAIQMEWDLFFHKVILFGFEKLFDLPLLWTAGYIHDHLRQEVDFVNEGKNAEKAFKHILEVDFLKKNIYVPKVFWEHTSKRILTAEWIEGVRFSDSAQIIKSGFSIKEVMDNIIRVFSDQIFRTGFVHCDPHPGNIIIRPNPYYPSRSQVVILDHGLYVTCSPQFTHDYSVFWKSIFLGDQERMHEISKNWGMSDLQLFASATLQKTWIPGKAAHISEKPSKMLKYIHNAEIAKERLRSFLKNTELLPKELIFIGRNMNCVRANNRTLGSPVNRINIMADMAVASLGADWTVWNSPAFSRMNSISKESFSVKLSNFIFSRLRFLYFKFILWTSSLAFNITKGYQYFQYLVFGTESEGFEAIADAIAMKKIEKELGLKIDARAFSG